ncbi:CoA ester lyase [Sphingomonas sp. AP4-R1]|uniref:HpcH/HpaI aldolase/citrate lyase family protein n=1 Tax=Sphingomonas sp. AP4-R1 TaxID=2735134 RepID=UPI001493A04F|nr:CoA ester lyase [Sphingomonas sp. AP4-R1]QJU59918.1 CoA ester lyase [Sphingomonas sp. AP4-R1]
MRLRSLLFVPGDRPDRMEKALGLGADALILDLEDSVAPAAKPAARAAIARFLRDAPRSARVLVRVNPLDSGLIDEDVAAVIAQRPDGLVLPKAGGCTSVTTLVGKAGDIPILPIATETPAAIFQLGSYAGVSRHLLGMTWGAEDLPAAMGASTSREEDGRFTAPYELARSLTLFGAHAAGVAAIETVYPAFRDLDGLAAYAARARRDGFTGMMAIHPSQVAVINHAFTLRDDELAHARAVIAAFEANPGVGALQMDGRMIDAPHLAQARRLLAAAGELK